MEPPFGNFNPEHDEAARKAIAEELAERGRKEALEHLNTRVTDSRAVQEDAHFHREQQQKQAHYDQSLERARSHYEEWRGLDERTKSTNAWAVENDKRQEQLEQLRGTPPALEQRAPLEIENPAPLTAENNQEALDELRELAEHEERISGEIGAFLHRFGGKEFISDRPKSELHESLMRSLTRAYMEDKARQLGPQPSLPAYKKELDAITTAKNQVITNQSTPTPGHLTWNTYYRSEPGQRTSIYHGTESPAENDAFLLAASVDPKTPVQENNTIRYSHVDRTDYGNQRSAGRQQNYQYLDLGKTLFTRFPSFAAEYAAIKQAAQIAGERNILPESINPNIPEDAIDANRVQTIVEQFNQLKELRERTIQEHEQRITDLTDLLRRGEALRNGHAQHQENVQRAQALRDQIARNETAVQETDQELEQTSWLAFKRKRELATARDSLSQSIATQRMTLTQLDVTISQYEADRTYASELATHLTADGYGGPEQQLKLAQQELRLLQSQASRDYDPYG